MKKRSFLFDGKGSGREVVLVLGVEALLKGSIFPAIMCISKHSSVGYKCVVNLGSLRSARLNKFL